MTNHKYFLNYFLAFIIFIFGITSCSSENNRIPSNEEVVSIATKKLKNSETSETIGYNPNTLVLRRVRMGASGCPVVKFTDTSQNMDIYVTVIGENRTEVSFDPEGSKSIDSL